MAKKKKESMVAYLSIPDTVAYAAHLLAEVTEAFLFEICPETPYVKRDYNLTHPDSRIRLESRGEWIRPVIKDRIYNMADYTVIYLGFTRWHYGIPRIIQSFLEEYDFTGKHIIPFTTKSAPELEAMAQGVKAMGEAYFNATWSELTILNDEPTKEELYAWLHTLPR